MSKENQEFNANSMDSQSESSNRPGPRVEMSKSEENLANIEHRVKKKAKRLVRVLSKEGVPNGHVFHAPRNWKNNRRPRKRYGRGLPKKGGAGGKGVWGKLGSELLEEDVDKNDLNYESDSLENGNVELAVVELHMSEEDIKKNIESLILEYYEHGDTLEASISIGDINFGRKRYLLSQLSIEIALDHKPSHREMTSVLLSDLYGHDVFQKDMTEAFENLLTNLVDLMLDTPDAPMVLGNFLARAIADDCMPPKIIHDFKEKFQSDQAQSSLNRAEMLLSSKHGLSRLDNVWGVSGGLRPVKFLTKQMNLLLQEYLSSGDIKEASRCVLDLEVPHFHHELVYEAIVMVLEAVNVTVEDQIAKLLKSLSDSIIVTPNMLERGFFRVFDDMPDIIIDVPIAAGVLERFIDKCQKLNGFITDDIIKRIPTRGRKRFVSEGDGGLIKEHAGL